MSLRDNNRINGVYVWPGLLKAVVPGDIFIHEYGLDALMCVCLWSRPYVGEDDEECCWIGTLAVGNVGPRFDQLWYRRDHPVWFPSPRLR